MSIFNRKKASVPPSPYPLDKFEPVLRSSICTGEMTACMRERETGKLHEVMVIRNYTDLAEFGRKYNVHVENMRTVY